MCKFMYKNAALAVKMNKNPKSKTKIKRLLREESRQSSSDFLET